MSSFIPPGEAYALISPQRSLVFGGHFYCSDFIDKSLRSITTLHYCRDQPDVPFKTHVPLLFFKLFDKVVDRILATQSIDDLPGKGFS